MMCLIFAFVAVWSPAAALEWVVMKSYLRSEGTNCQGPVDEWEVYGPKDVCYLHQRENGPFYKKLTCSDTKFDEITYSDDQCTMAVSSPSPVSRDLACQSSRDFDRTFQCALEAPAIIALEFAGNEAPSCTPDTHQKEQYWPYGMCLPQKFSAFSEWTCLHSGAASPQVRLSYYASHSHTNCSGTTQGFSWSEPRFVASGACQNSNAKMTESYRRRYYKYLSGCPEPPTTTTFTTMLPTTSSVTKGPCTLTTVLESSHAYTTCALAADRDLQALCACIESADSDLSHCSGISGIETELADLKSILAGSRTSCTSSDSGVSATTTIGIEIHTRITGTLNIEVPDADVFLTDYDAQSAVTEAIAEELGVPSSYITLFLTKVSRRLAIDRRLAGTKVNIDYSVDIPKSASSSLASTVSNSNAMTTSSLQSAVASKIAATKGSDYTLTILSSTPPAITLLDTTSKASYFSDSVPRNAACSFWIVIALIALA